MLLRPISFVLIAFLPAACAEQSVEAPEPNPTGGTALNPERPEMIEPFQAMSLAVDPAEPASAFPDLEIEVQQEGAGESIRYGEIGRFHVIGSLAGGKIFKTTYQGDDPKPELLRLIPGAVPKGLALALDGCKLGERRLISVPSELGFGDKPEFGQGAPIPPNSRLVYEVELVEVVRDLAIKILEPGTGDELQYGQTAKFHYTGVRADDAVQFDSSEGRDPFQTAVQVGPIIQGWTFGLPGMKVGEKRRLRIPSDMAYGPQGNPPSIGPDQELVFDVNLVEILP